MKGILKKDGLGNWMCECYITVSHSNKNLFPVLSVQDDFVDGKQIDFEIEWKVVNDFAERHAKIIPTPPAEKNIREKITEILYKNSIDDSESLRIRFENIEKVIDLIVDTLKTT